MAYKEFCENINYVKYLNSFLHGTKTLGTLSRPILWASTALKQKLPLTCLSTISKSLMHFLGIRLVPTHLRAGVLYRWFEM